MRPKRIQVQLPPEVFSVVEEISALGGVSMGGLLAEMISENVSGLELIRDALIAAKNHDMSGAIDKIQTMLLDSMGDGVELNKEINKVRNEAKK